MFQGENVFLYDDIKLAEFRNRTVGFVFQFHHLLPEFSALENSMMPALVNGFNKPEAGKAAEEVLVRVGLQDRLHHRVGKLSGGEQQRVALARALVLKPAILLADEPTGNLDQMNSEQVHQLLMELNQERLMTLVVVTHNMELASYMSRCVTIAEGRLQEAS
jgi:lipoprotein-releasing system ATP-binding protein